MNDLIYRQAAIDALGYCQTYLFDSRDDDKKISLEDAEYVLEQLPSAQSKRDIPIKPKETTDRAWGIPNRQAVCPNCDCYLGIMHFLGEGHKVTVTYCESCGQAIDWEWWED